MKVSIIELSKKLNVSRQSIYYYLNNYSDVKELFEKDPNNNSYVFDLKNINKLARTMKIDYQVDDKSETESESEVFENTDNSIVAYEKLIEIMEKENEFLKKQIQEKDEQINKLMQLNHNNQILMLENGKNSENKTENISDINSSEVQEPQENKLHWWQRLFK